MNTIPHPDTVKPEPPRRKNGMQLRYCCRRCGKVFYEGDSMSFDDAVDELRRVPLGGYSRLFAIHQCDAGAGRGAMGIADLQGAS